MIARNKIEIEKYFLFLIIFIYTCELLSLTKVSQPKTQMEQRVRPSKPRKYHSHIGPPLVAHQPHHKLERKDRKMKHLTQQSTGYLIVIIITII